MPEEQEERNGYLAHWNQGDGGCTLIFHIPSEGDLRLNFDPQQATILKRELIEATGTAIVLRNGSLRLLRTQSNFKFIIAQLTHTLNMNVPEEIVRDLFRALP